MSRRGAFALLALFLAGTGTAVALAGTGTTVTACATTPAQTLADNGTPVATVPASIACATVTVPTVTVTVGGTTTTPATTTTSTGTPTYDSAISYTQNRPAFTATHTVSVATATDFKNALANLAAGDLVQATADFTVTGETVISARPSSTAVIDLSGHNVKFVYSGGSNLPAVWLKNTANIRIYGGDLSTSDSGGTCLLDHGSQQVLWWGFSIHDCGGSGFAAFTVGAAVDHDDFQGTITKVGQNLAWDPHAEKGTGLHGAILWDASTSYPFTNNRFAFYAHDIPVGACVSLGNPVSAPASGNVLYLKCVNETDVSTIQTGGNGLQFWGVNIQSLDVKYLEVTNAQGYGVHDSGMYSGTTLAGVTVDYGRAANTDLNLRYAGQNPWQTDKAIVYRDVLPAP